MKKKAVITVLIIVILAALGFGAYKAKQYYDGFKANSASAWYHKACMKAEELAGCRLYQTNEQPLGEDAVVYTLSDAPSGGEDRFSFVISVEHTDFLKNKFYTCSQMLPLMTREFFATEDISVSVNQSEEGKSPANESAPLSEVDLAMVQTSEDLGDEAHLISEFGIGVRRYIAGQLCREEQLSIRDAFGNAPLVSQLDGLPFYYSSSSSENAASDEGIKAFRAAMSEKLVRTLATENKALTSLKITEPMAISGSEALIGLQAVSGASGSSPAPDTAEFLRIYRITKDEDGSWKTDQEISPEETGSAFMQLYSLLGTATDEAIFVIPHSEKFPYYIKVNRLMNTVTIYGPDANGDYTVPVKAMVCSTGREGHETPLGDFEVMNFKARWCYMIDGTYGQYATGFRSGGYLFHSICYHTKSTSDMIVDEYNLLGNYASLGCVRLQTVDAKWIFDNCPVGTKVTIYEDENPGPLGKPEKAVAEITADMENGWDPTDPSEGNPWKQ